MSRISNLAREGLCPALFVRDVATGTAFVLLTSHISQSSKLRRYTIPITMCKCNETNDSWKENDDAKVRQHAPTKTASPQAKALLHDLSSKEVELAARTDYRYLTKQTNNREASALAMAERYVRSKSSYSRALKSIRVTLDYRANRAMDAMRSIHDMSDSLRENLSNGNAYVTGRDKDGRSTLVFVPRLVDDHEGSVDGLLWTLERAIACTQANSEINAIVDFSGFDLWKHTPPISVGKRILTLLRHHYVGHVHRIFFLHAPTSVNYLWNTFKAFAGQKTKEKIAFVRGSDLEKLYAKDQLPRSIMAAGTRIEFDADSYFAVDFDGIA